MGKSQSKLTPEELADLQKIARFGKKELQARHNDFLRDYPSGKINKEGFRRIYGRLYYYSDDAGQFPDYTFNVFNSEDDGTIDFKKFICAVSITTRGTLDEKLKWGFLVYDIDRSWTISYDGMLQVTRAIYKLNGQVFYLPEDEDTPEKRVDKIFKAMGKDKDDRVTYPEYVEASKLDPRIFKVGFRSNL